VHRHPSSLLTDGGFAGRMMLCWWCGFGTVCQVIQNPRRDHWVFDAGNHFDGAATLI
jgi:hypothetical protein